MSYADFLALPADSPGEVIEGELVVGAAPFTRHQYIADTITASLRVYLDAHPGMGLCFSAPCDVVLRAERPAVVLQPDVLFVSAEREHLVGNVVMGAPDLVVEVVSQGSARIDTIQKPRLYARYGVREYWLVWPEDERLDVFALDAAGARYTGPRTLAAGERLASPLLPGFELAVDRLFAWRPKEGGMREAP